MPNLGLLPLQGTLVNNITTATTTSGVSGALSIPLCGSYRMVLEVHTVSGTSPTLDVFVSTSQDGGSNYNQFLHFAQATTSGAGAQLVFCPFKIGQQSASSGASALDGTATLATGATAIVNDAPIDPAHVKVRWVVSGTTPSFAFAVKWNGEPAGASDN